MTATTAFDVGGPLPVGGTTLIEASAGTGKTYTLAGLTVRYVAEHGTPIGDVLLVTFTRAATAELRGRIRTRLVEAEHHLRPLIAGGVSPSPTDDPVLAALARGSRDEMVVRHGRLADAVREFDTATISTIHGFCSRVRALMGVLSGENVDAVPAESETSLITQVCADLYFDLLGQGDPEPLGGRSLDDLVAMVDTARTLNGCRVQAAGGPVDERTVAFVERAVREVDERLRRQGALSFDTLLTSVRDALRSDRALVAALRAAHPVVMIDEFQDTDPVQWEIFRTVFAPEAPCDPAPTLVLVGDPKQAIYSFRGGDVYTYLDAKGVAEPVALTTNQRSDETVLAAMNALGGGQTFGEDDIAYEEVATAERNRGRRALLPDDCGLPGLEVRCLVDAKGVAGGTTVGPVRGAIARDLAGVVHHLVSEVRIPADDGGLRPVSPGDVAVLVGARSEARPVVTALRELEIPVVLRLRDDVADSPAREQWRTLLHALDRPASASRAAAAALTWFFDWTPDDVAAAIDAPVDQGDGPAADLVRLQGLLAEWSDLLTAKGIAALLGEARRSHDMVRRLLAGPDGERNLTDLEHLAELVHLEAGDRGRGLTAGTALAVLDSLGGTPDDELARDTAQRRIESDARAVQVLTIHGAKGLEFPFVLVPGLWSGHRATVRAPYAYHDPALPGRVLDVTASVPDPDGGDSIKPSERAPGAHAEAKRQACGDLHRLTYVAATRAVHQTVAWWSVPRGSKVSGLARLLFGAAGLGADQEVKLPKPGQLVDHLRARAEELGAAGDIAVHEITTLPTREDLGPLPVHEPRDPDELKHLEVASLGRVLRRSDRTWSFTALTRGASHHEAEAGGPGTGEATDPTDDTAPDHAAGDEAGRAADEATEPAPPAESVLDGLWERAPSFVGIGGGTALGNVVHHVLEHVDLAGTRPEDAVRAALAAPGLPPVTDPQRAALPALLAEVLATPLGPAFAGRALADVPDRDRLAELTFHLPLAPHRSLSPSRLGAVVADHLDRHDPLRPWATGLRTRLRPGDLQGVLTGSIDLTLRVEVDGVTRYSVLDYKTNDLTPPGEEPSLQHYRHERLVRAMAHSDYALQALIYTVALHRYLRWRLPGYDPATHLGPVGYLFVRGMVGPDTPFEADGPRTGARAGVFTWDVPPALFEDLSDLFARGAAAEGGAA